MGAIWPPRGLENRATPHPPLTKAVQIRPQSEAPCHPAPCGSLPLLTPSLISISLPPP